MNTPRPQYATLKYPAGLPKQPLRVRTVLPDKVLDPTLWVTYHRVNNKVCISIADHAERTERVS